MKVFFSFRDSCFSGACLFNTSRNKEIKLEGAKIVSFIASSLLQSINQSTYFYLREKNTNNKNETLK